MGNITITKNIDLMDMEVEVDFTEDDLEEYVMTLSPSERRELVANILSEAAGEVEDEAVVQHLERIPFADTIALFQQYVGMCDDESAVRSILEFSMARLDALEKNKKESAKADELAKKVKEIETQLEEAKRLAAEHLLSRLAI